MDYHRYQVHFSGRKRTTVQIFSVIPISAASSGGLNEQETAMLKQQRFLYGDLKVLQPQKLDLPEELGVSCIYLNPYR